MDPAGKIQIIEINAGGIGRDASELLRKVKAAQYVASHRARSAPPSGRKGTLDLAPVARPGRKDLIHRHPAPPSLRRGGIAAFSRLPTLAAPPSQVQSPSAEVKPCSKANIKNQLAGYLDKLCRPLIELIASLDDSATKPPARCANC